MNTRLLRKIAKVIQEKPRQFNMGRWHRDTGAYNGLGLSVEALCQLPKERQVSCTTTHCIAGWAQVLDPDRSCGSPAEKDARRLLGISDVQARHLFYADKWPKQFQGTKDAYRMYPAKAAARIEHFIKTGGAE